MNHLISLFYRHCYRSSRCAFSFPPSFLSVSHCPRHRILYIHICSYIRFGVFLPIVRFTDLWHVSSASSLILTPGFLSDHLWHALPVILLPFVDPLPQRFPLVWLLSAETRPSSSILRITLPTSGILIRYLAIVLTHICLLHPHTLASFITPFLHRFPACSSFPLFCTLIPHLPHIPPFLHLNSL